MMWTITPTQRPWYYALKGPYSDAVRAEMKLSPGCQWSPLDRAWLVPFDLVGDVSNWLRTLGMEHSVSERLTPPIAGLESLPFELHPFQQEGLERFHLRGGAVLSYEMGLGKTPTALAIGHTVPGTKLVVCPPGVLSTWKEQLTRFDIPAEVIETGKVPASPRADGWLICTSACLDKLPGNLNPKLVVLDEAHNIKSSKTELARFMRTLRKSKPTIPFLAMTGTLAADTLIDVYNPIDLVFPGALGNWKAWRSHYFWLEHRSGGGREWDEVMGLHPINGPMLRRRLKALVCQASEAEQAHLLPPKSVEKVWVDLPKIESLVDDVGSPDFHAKFLQKHGLRKAAAVAKLAVDEGAVTDSPIACLFVHRSSAAKAQEFLGPDWVLITGAMSPAKREKAIAEARLEGKGIVATMAAIKEGIDLTAWPTVIVGEFPYYPAMLLQVLKRFHRLNSPGPVKYLMVVGRGTVDETISAVVEDKINNSRGAIDVGGMGDSISGVAGVSDLAAIFGGDDDDS